MKVIAFLNPENGTCAQTVSTLFKLFKQGVEIEKVYLVLENTYHAEKWVLSFAMPVSKEEIESIKKTYIKKILAEWEALAGEPNLPVEAEVNEVKKVIEKLNLDEYDQVVLGCLDEKSLCKLIENLDKPVLVVKN
jgi:hypothetical protein